MLCRLLITYLLITACSCLRYRKATQSFLQPVLKSKNGKSHRLMQRYEEAANHPYNLLKSREYFIKSVEWYIKNSKAYNYKQYKPYTPSAHSTNFTHKNYFLSLPDLMQTQQKKEHIISSTTESSILSKAGGAFFKENYTISNMSTLDSTDKISQTFENIEISTAEGIKETYMTTTIPTIEDFITGSLLPISTESKQETETTSISGLNADGLEGSTQKYKELPEQFESTTKEVFQPTTENLVETISTSIPFFSTDQPENFNISTFNYKEQPEVLVDPKFESTTLLILKTSPTKQEIYQDFVFTTEQIESRASLNAVLQPTTEIEYAIETSTTSELTTESSNELETTTLVYEYVTESKPNSITSKEALIKFFSRYEGQKSHKEIDFKSSLMAPHSDVVSTTENNDVLWRTELHDTILDAESVKAGEILFISTNNTTEREQLSEATTTKSHIMAAGPKSKPISTPNYDLNSKPKITPSFSSIFGTAQSTDGVSATEKKYVSFTTDTTNTHEKEEISTTNYDHEEQTENLNENTTSASSIFGTPTYLEITNSNLASKQFESGESTTGGIFVSLTTENPQEKQVDDVNITAQNIIDMLFAGYNKNIISTSNEDISSTDSTFASKFYDFTTESIDKDNHYGETTALVTEIRSTVPAFELTEESILETTTNPLNDKWNHLLYGTKTAVINHHASETPLFTEALNSIAIENFPQFEKKFEDDTTTMFHDILNELAIREAFVSLTSQYLTTEKYSKTEELSHTNINNAHLFQKLKTDFSIIASLQQETTEVVTEVATVLSSVIGREPDNDSALQQKSSDNIEFIPATENSVELEITTISGIFTANVANTKTSSEDLTKFSASYDSITERPIFSEARPIEAQREIKKFSYDTDVMPSLGDYDYDP